MTSSNENIFHVTGHSCGDFPAQRPVMRNLMFSLICAWINGRVNNGDAGDLRRHRAHYDVTVMDLAVMREYQYGERSDSRGSPIKGYTFSKKLVTANHSNAI